MTAFAIMSSVYFTDPAVPSFDVSSFEDENKKAIISIDIQVSYTQMYSTLFSY